MGKAEAVEAFRARFDEVVKDHLMADVPVASYLSGGIDSVSVAARARVHAPLLNTFSMTFGGADARYDESSHSDLAARHLGIEAHHRVPWPRSARRTSWGRCARWRRPRCTPWRSASTSSPARCATRASRWCSRARGRTRCSRATGRSASRACAGCWAGAGASCGAGWCACSSAARCPTSAGRCWGGGARSPEWPSASASCRRGWSSGGSSGTRRRRCWTPELAFGAGVEALPEPPADLALLARAPLHDDLLFEQASRLDGWVLGMGDRLSMAHSVEARVPFLDHRLVDLAASLPPRRLLKGTNEKWILRAAMQGDLPPALAQRRKRAFMAPSTEWLFGASPPGWVQDALSPARLAAAHVFDPKAVAKALARVPQARGLEAMALGMSLTAVLSTVIWAEQFAVGDVRGP
ncbi:MAG: asparagine synthase [Deltaproteobacteria bacterium]|nr:asparagine synthase [Deltaproteobacteria bacterium]